MPFHIAIDGPVAAGKGTVSRLVADRLNLMYVDTGAMYRMTALLAVENDVDFEDDDKIAELINKSYMDMSQPTEEEKDGRPITVTLDGEDVSWKIRTEQISWGASVVSTHPKVRKILVKKQQHIAKNKDVIMEGRDITYKVLPNADIKIYLTANDKVRAQRRHVQMLIKGEDVPLEQILADLKKRDLQDMSRKADPLRATSDAEIIDTSDMTIEQVVDLIVEKADDLRRKKDKS